MLSVASCDSQNISLDAFVVVEFFRRSENEVTGEDVQALPIVFANSMRRVNFRNRAECAGEVDFAVSIKSIART